MAKQLPAQFPNSKSLQPIPVFVHPNIAGNVNSSLAATTTYVDTGNTDQNTISQPIIASTTTVSQPFDPSTLIWPGIYILIFCIAILVVVRILRGGQSENS